MSFLANAKILQFARVPGDFKSTNRVQLDNPGPSFGITLRWMPQAGIWTLDLFSGSTVLARGCWVRDRTDCLLGISTPGRPLGAIMSYDPLRRGQPGLDAYTTGGCGLYYIPTGLNPVDWVLPSYQAALLGTDS